MSHLLNEFLGNFVLVSVCIAWFLAQSLKVVIYRFTEGYWKIWHFFEAGGMPSAHSAAVTSLTLALALSVGWQSHLFVISLVFALIVMYDAAGVRRAAGKQAEILNKIVDDIYASSQVKVEKLKEILGHDVSEVIGGATLATIVTLVCYYVYFIK